MDSGILRHILLVSSANGARGSIQIQISEDAHRHDILPGFPYLLEKKEEKKKFYYLGSCGADAIREAVT